ncbi:MAG: hypothetical protein R2684_17365 [Pyrinomonadaceae bacterium]
MTRNSLYLLLTVFAGLLLATTSFGQKRDHLTAEEIELVRDVQHVEDRMEVFVHAIERRIYAITGIETLSADDRKRIEKDVKHWGELPKGTKAQLYDDIARILDEAVDKFEDVYDRKADDEYLPYAFYTLYDYCVILRPKLAAYAEKTEDKKELSALERADGNCAEVIDAASKIDRPTQKKKKRKPPES